MDAFFERLSIVLGGNIPRDHLKLMACVLATYPGALLYRRLPADKPALKHLFSIVYVFFTMLVVLRFYVGFMHIGLTALFTYYFMKYYHGSNGPWINFAISMLSMSLCHLDRQFKGYEGDSTLDYSGSLMILTIKTSSFGFNVLDGRRGAATEYNKRMKIEKYPSLLEYFGWICFFGGFMAGPTCEYMDYFRYTNFYFLSKDSKLSPYGPTIKVLAKSITFAVWVILFAPTFNFFNLLTPEYARLPFLSRVWYLQVSGFLTRCKYYCIWLLSEGTCILSGFGFNGYKDGQPQWDRLRNIDVVVCETSQSYNELSRAWNLGANKWLRHYVYLRVTPPGTKPTSTAAVITYTTSAFWHGFHPGYYLFFCSVSIYQILGRRIRKCVRPLTLTQDQRPLPFLKQAYDTAGWLLTMGILNILICPFDLLRISRIHRVWSSVYYVHYWMLAVGWLLIFAFEPTLLAYIKRRELPKEKQEPFNPVEQAVENLGLQVGTPK